MKRPSGQFDAILQRRHSPQDDNSMPDKVVRRHRTQKLGRQQLIDKLKQARSVVSALDPRDGELNRLLTMVPAVRLSRLPLPHPSRQDHSPQQLTRQLKRISACHRQLQWRLHDKMGAETREAEPQDWVVCNPLLSDRHCQGSDAVNLVGAGDELVGRQLPTQSTIYPLGCRYRHHRGPL